MTAANHHGGARTTVAEPSRELTMGLKAPGLLVFLLSLVAALAVLFARYFSATIPFMNTEAHQFYGLLVAYAVLFLGCLMRGL